MPTFLLPFLAGLNKIKGYLLAGLSALLALFFLYTRIKRQGANEVIIEQQAETLDAIKERDAFSHSLPSDDDAARQRLRDETHKRLGH